MNEEEILLEFAKQVRSRMMKFDVWYAENIHGLDDTWKFNVKAVTEFEQIGDLYHQLEEDLMEVDE